MQNDEVTILMGDFNADVGNERGKRLIKICTENMCIMNIPNNAYTRRKLERIH